jgi:hypothetical protein
MAALGTSLVAAFAPPADCSLPCCVSCCHWLRAGDATSSFSCQPPIHVARLQFPQKFIRQQGVPVDTACRVYRRYLKLEPEHTEEYIEYLKSQVCVGGGGAHVCVWGGRVCGARKEQGIHGFMCGFYAADSGLWLRIASLSLPRIWSAFFLLAQWRCRLAGAGLCLGLLVIRQCLHCSPVTRVAKAA